MKQRTPIPNCPRISNIESLSNILSTTKSELLHIADNAANFWKPGKIETKKNGDPRITNDAKEPLKKLHENIKIRFFRKISYPYYITGGIYDPITPRSTIHNAKFHSGCGIVITEDISDFFPSTTYDVVKNIWKYLFCFTPEIADLMTKLTTHEGVLPQGWITSGYLANLVFWDKEPSLVEDLENRGFAYSRFIDDIAISTKSYIDNKVKTDIISSVNNMLVSKGYEINRQKHSVMAASNPMLVTGLTINSKSPSISKKERRIVRSMIHKLELTPENLRRTRKYTTQWRSISGKVSQIMSLHKTTGKQFRERLTAIKPPALPLSPAKVGRLEKELGELEIAIIGKNCLMNPLMKLNQLTGKVGELKAANHDDWIILNAKLDRIRIVITNK